MGKREIKAKNIKNFIIIAFILVIGLTIRLAMLIKYGANFTLNSDDMGYVHSAINLLQSGKLTYHSPTQSTAYIMPGQPILLASIFYLFGTGYHGMFVAKVLMIIFGMTSILTTYLIGKEIWRREIGWVASFLFSVYPTAWLFDNLTLTESPFTCMFLLLIYFSIRYGKNAKKRYFLLIIVFYLASLFLRPTIALYPLILIIYLLAQKYPISTLLKQAAIAVVMVSLIMAPWWIRNYELFHRFIPLSSGAGDPLLLGTYQGVGYPGGLSYKQIYDKIKKENPALMRDDFVYYEAIEAKKRMAEWWNNDKKSMLYSYLYLKPKLFWRTSFMWVTPFKLNLRLIEGIHKKEVELGFLGLIVCSLVYRKIRKEMILFLGILIYFTVSYSFYYAFNRYNFPLIPIVLLGDACLIGSLARFVMCLFKHKQNNTSVV
jgi:4-amino-4-deoxy-L-arabinose transferase-like glycosyltransferase